MRKHFVSVLAIIATLTSVHKAGAFCCVMPEENPADSLSLMLPSLHVEAASDKSTRSANPYSEINASDILTRGVSDISDAMRRLPGVNLRDYGGAGGLKTVSVRGLGAQHTTVVYDGAPVTDLRNGAVDLSRYSLDNLNSIGLAAGDSDDIFMAARAAASSSSLYITSLQPKVVIDRNLSLKAQMRFGSFGMYNPYLRVVKGLSEKFSLAGTAEFHHARNDYPFTLTNGIYKTKEHRQNSQMNSAHAEINTLWKPNPSSSLSSKIYFYNNARHLPGPVIYYVADNNERLQERDFFAQTSCGTRLSSKLSLKATGRFDWSSSDYRDINGIYPGGRLHQYYIQRETYASASLLYLPVQSLSLSYAADWTWNNLTSNQPLDIEPFRNSLIQSLAAKYQLRKLDIVVRAIHSLYLNSARSGQAAPDASRLSPAVALSFKPFEDKEIRVRASYKNIFRMPTFTELYYAHYGTLNLDPEDTDQFNLGLTWRSENTNVTERGEVTFNATFDGYLNFVKNKIVAIPYNMYLYTMTNLGRVSVYGIDAAADCRVGIARGQSLEGALSYSYTRAMPRISRDRADWMKQLAYTPLNSGSLSLSWLNPWVNLSAHGVASGARYTTNDNISSSRIRGYVDCGFSIFRDFTLRRTSLQLRADMLNAFNRQYEIIARYPMPGRSWRLSLSIEI